MPVLNNEDRLQPMETSLQIRPLARHSGESRNPLASLEDQNGFRLSPE
jgi:hypothetical protein